MDMCLPKFDIYQGKVAPNYFKSHTNSWCPDFFQKKSLPDVRSDIRLAQRNIVSTGLKNLYSGVKFESNRNNSDCIRVENFRKSVNF